MIFTVGKGNNGHLIKDLIKKRWWWTIQDEKNKKTVNFSWTQLKDKNYYQSELKENKIEDLNRDVINNQSGFHIVEENRDIFERTVHNHF